MSDFRYLSGTEQLKNKKVLGRLAQKSVDSSSGRKTLIGCISKKRENVVGTSKNTQNKRIKLIAPLKRNNWYEELLRQEGFPSTSTAGRTQAIERKINVEEIVSISSEDSDSMSLSDISDDLCSSNSESETYFERTEHLPQMTRKEKKTLKEGDYVIVYYRKQYKTGVIYKMPDEGERGPSIDCMERRTKCWIWPQKKDKVIYRWKNIVTKIKPPKPLSTRGHFVVPVLDAFISF